MKSAIGARIARYRYAEFRCESGLLLCMESRSLGVDYRFSRNGAAGPAPRTLVLARRGCGALGDPIEVHFFAIYTIQDGEVRRVEYFRHRADALKAASLSE